MKDFIAGGIRGILQSPAKKTPQPARKGRRAADA
jgi:hypothetical protein